MTLKELRKRVVLILDELKEQNRTFKVTTFNYAESRELLIKIMVYEDILKMIDF